MRWPWIARTAYDAVCAERDRLVDSQRDLHTELRELRDHLTRVDRFQHGLTETPRTPRPDPGPIPKDIEEQIMGYLNPATRGQMRRECRRLVRDGQSWDTIRQMVFDPIRPETALEADE